MTKVALELRFQVSEASIELARDSTHPRLDDVVRAPNDDDCVPTPVTNALLQRPQPFLSKLTGLVAKHTPDALRVHSKDRLCPLERAVSAGDS